LNVCCTCGVAYVNCGLRLSAIVYLVCFYCAGNIRVLCRVRPVIPEDGSVACTVISFDQDDDSLVYVDRSKQKLTFGCDHVFTMQSTQEEVFGFLLFMLFYVWFLGTYLIIDLIQCSFYGVLVYLNFHGYTHTRALLRASCLMTCPRIRFHGCRKVRKLVMFETPVVYLPFNTTSVYSNIIIRERVCLIDY
jgi:hypothetical protein